MPWGLRMSRERIAARLEEIRAAGCVVAHCEIERPCEIVAPDDPVFGARPLPRLNAVWRCPVCGCVEYSVGSGADVSGTLADVETVRLRARAVELRRRLCYRGAKTAEAAMAVAPIGSVGKLERGEVEALIASLVSIYSAERRARRAEERRAKRKAESAPS